MPPITRIMVKTSLVYLALALLAWTGLALNGLVDLPAAAGGLFPVAIHLLVIGWLSQLIFGIAFWMFPKHSREKPRGSDTLGWGTYILLNLGLALRALAEPWQAQSPGPAPAWLLVISALLQWLAGMLFVINTWGRVKEK